MYTLNLPVMSYKSVVVNYLVNVKSENKLGKPVIPQFSRF